MKLEQMDSRRWQQMDALLQAALSLAPDERTAYLQQACGADAALRAEVEALLAAVENDSAFLSAPVFRFHHEPATLAGQRFGPYRAVRELGRGGMGTVWLAERADGQFQQQVALKLIKRGMDTEEIISRFQAERQILAQLNHPNIARLFDGGASAEGLPYFVMEYIDGQPLTDYCEQQQLSIRQRLELFLAVCAAVQHAHQHLVIHRDLKPGNILVRADGVVKLLDFGLAKLLDSHDAQTATRTAARRLTPAYASPEQLLGQPLSTASDVYALGVVLYELLSGGRPHHSEPSSAEALARLICQVEPAPPSARLQAAPHCFGAARVETLQRHLRGDLDNIVLKALRIDPTRRYASVEQLAADIRCYLAGLPVSARPESFSYLARKFVQRHRVGVLAVAFVLLALLGSLGASARAARIAEIARREAVLARERAEALRQQAEIAQATAQREQTRAQLAQAQTEMQRHRAAQAQHRAELQRARAETALGQAEIAGARAARRFSEVRQLSQTLLFEVYDAVQKLPNSMQAQALIVKHGLVYLDSLAREADDDADLLRELAAGYERVGDVQGNSASGHLGQLSGALQSYRRALALRQTLAQATPSDWSARYHQVRLYRKLAETHQLNQQFDEALAHYQQGSRLADDLSNSPSALPQLLPGLRQERLWLKGALGRLLRQSGTTAEAQAQFAQVETLLAEQTAALALPQRQLHYEQAINAVDLGKLEQALDHFRQYLPQLENALAAQPSNQSLRRGYAVTLANLGKVLGKLGRATEASAYLQQALAYWREITVADPANIHDRFALSDLHSDWADELRRSQQYHEAIAHYQQAVASTQEILRRVPASDKNARRELTHYYYRLAECWLKLDEPRPAIEQLHHSIALRETLAAEQAESVWAQLEPVYAYDLLSEAHARLASRAGAAPTEHLAQWQASRTWHEKSLAIFLNLQQRGRLPEKYAAQRELTLQAIRHCDQALAQLQAQLQESKREQR